MAHTRRNMLKATALGCGTCAVGASLPGFASRKPDPCDFSGSGLYLYPHWGDARTYFVTESPVASPTLEFRDPGSLRLLWTQSLSLTDGFAGKLV